MYSGYGKRTSNYRSSVQKRVTLAQANFMAQKAATVAAAKVASSMKKSAPKKSAARSSHKASHKSVHQPKVAHKGSHSHTTKEHSTTGLGRLAGQLVGGMLPVPLGGEALGWLGDKLEDGIGSLFGFGEYKVETNSLMDQGGNVIPEGSRPPEVINSSHDGSSVIVRHQESLGDIVTSSTAGAFNLQNFYVNPGLPSTMPWLSAMAGNFQQWKPRGILFEFRSMAADAISGTNIALGTVTMASNYDATDPNYENKKAMQNSEYATSTKPSLSVFHPIECDPKVTFADVLFVRTGNINAGTDQRLYDLCNFQIATSGFQGTSVTIGELWITYEIELIKPTAVALAGNNILSAHMRSTTYTPSWPFQGFVQTAASNLSLTAGTTTLTFNASSGLAVGQQFLVLIYYQASGAVPTVGAPTFTYTGLQALNAFQSGYQAQGPASGVAANNMMISLMVQVTSVATNPQITVGSFTMPSSSGVADIYVTQVGPNFN
jgi:hypothetical protein